MQHVWFVSGVRLWVWDQCCGNDLCFGDCVSGCLCGGWGENCWDDQEGGEVCWYVSSLSASRVGETPAFVLLVKETFVVRPVPRPGC